MAAKARESRRTDYGILIPTLLLVGIGLVFIYSSSSFLAEHRLGDSYFFLKRQGVFCLVGLFLLIVAKNVPSTVYARCVYPLLLVSLALLLALLIPGVGTTVGGASRWLRFAGFSFQPSELAKLSLAVYIAYYVGINMVQKLQGEVVPQVGSTIMNPIGGAYTPVDNLIMIVGVLAVLVYFYFSIEHKGAVGGISRLGIWFLMLGFGAAFGYTVMGRVSLLIGRMNYLFIDVVRATGELL